jgi:hypothetical protein
MATMLDNAAAVDAAVIASAFPDLKAAQAAFKKTRPNDCFWLHDPIGLANGPTCPFSANKPGVKKPCGFQPPGH